MAKRLQEDFVRRKSLKKIETFKIILKVLFLNKTMPNYFRAYIFFLINTLSKNSLKIRTENRCLLTGRGSGVFSFFGLSRIAVRREGFKRNIPGLRKNSW